MHFNCSCQRSNRMLCEKPGDKHLRFSDDHRRHSAVRAPPPRSNSCRSAWPPRTAIGATEEFRALVNLGHEVASSTIANILLEEHGLEPAPECKGKTTWKEFLSRHREVIVAADFFTIEAWARGGLTRFFVLFLTDLSSRRVEIAGLSRQRNGLWMSQIARNLTDAADGFLVGKRYLIYNQDPLFTAEFLTTLVYIGGCKSPRLRRPAPARANHRRPRRATTMRKPESGQIADLYEIPQHNLTLVELRATHGGAVIAARDEHPAVCQQRCRVPAARRL